MKAVPVIPDDGPRFIFISTEVLRWLESAWLVEAPDGLGEEDQKKKEEVVMIMISLYVVVCLRIPMEGVKLPPTPPMGPNAPNTPQSTVQGLHTGKLLTRLINMYVDVYT